jgi:spermidine/putrescine transport system permease protein
MKKTKILGYPYVFWMALFILFSDGTDDDLRLHRKRRDGDAVFSREHPRVFHPDLPERISQIALNSPLISTVLCLALGYPMRVFLSAAWNEKKRNFFLILVILPTWMNFLLRTYSWMNILGKNGIINKLLELLNLPAADLLYNNGAVLLGMIYNFLPFMIYPIYSILVKIKPAIWKPPWISAQAKAGRSSKCAAAFRARHHYGHHHGLYARGEHVRHSRSARRRTERIDRKTSSRRSFWFSGDWNFGSALSVIMMLVILIAMRIMNRFDSTDDKENALW